MRQWLTGGGIYASLLVAVCALVQISGGQQRAMSQAIGNAGGRAADLQRSVITARSELSSAIAAHRTLATLADPPDWSLLLIGLPASAGSEIKLRDIHLVGQDTSHNAGNNSADPPQTFEVRLNGICQSQPAVSTFVQQLQNDGLFSRVELLRSGREAIQNGTGVAFDVRCVIGGNPAGNIAAERESR